MSPIFIDPSVVAPVLPDPVHSPDEKLFAVRRGMGVLLKARFLNAPAKRANLALDPVFTDPTGMTSGGGAVRTGNTAWKMHGTQSVKITPSGTDSASATYVASSANSIAMVPGETYTVSAWVRVDAVQTGTLNSAARRIVVGYINDDGVYNYTLATSAAAANVAGTVVRLSVTVTMPADTAKPLVRLMNGLANESQTVSWSAVLIEKGSTVGSFFYYGTPSDGDWQYRATGVEGDSVSIADPAHALQKVRFVRGSGTLVRSGHDAWAPDGIAFAFDNEAAPGSVATYQAFPVDKNGVLGEPSEQLAISIPQIADGMGCWLKSIEQPTLSLALDAQVPDPELTSDSRTNLTDIPGSPFPAGTWDRRIQRARSFTFKTSTKVERDALLALLDSGPLLWQGLEMFGIADFYCLPGDVNEKYLVGAYDPRRLITVSLTPVDRPPTLDVPMAGAGRSYDWLATQVETLDQIPVLFPTYPDIIESGGPPLVAP